MSAIAGLEPAAVWKYFSEISQIPRESGNEGGIRDYILNFAREQAVEAVVDPVGNVILRKPASPDREEAPTIILQGHMDMVCEKEPGVNHDFSADPIRLIRHGDWMGADGTTLGADNGVALAYILALFCHKNLVHGPLEALLTVDEEVGFTGALGVDPELLEGRILLNLDSEEDDTLCIGCAGGVITRGLVPVDTEEAPADWRPFAFYVHGLQGGHSGGDIHRGLGNALSLAASALTALERLGCRLYAFQGGSKDNVIPRECYAGVLVPPGAQTEAEAVIREQEAGFRETLGDLEPDLRFEWREAGDAGGNPSGKDPSEKDLSGPGGFSRVLTSESFRRSIGVVMSLPHGVIGMSRRIPGLVETSTNLAAAHLGGDGFHLLTHQRSSSGFLRDTLGERVMAAIRSAGGSALQECRYEGWSPDTDSPLLQSVSETYRGLFGEYPKVEAVHGGLECGEIGARIPGIQMISLGPRVERVHTPEERLHIPSMEKIWRLLTEILATT